uniref:DNA encoding a truncated polypeptide n=1 Tax=Loa loa TaxID=7209 RepID=Q25304_LOALO|nr:truncated polypeptide [Loa loa]
MNNITFPFFPLNRNYVIFIPLSEHVNAILNCIQIQIDEISK